MTNHRLPLLMDQRGAALPTAMLVLIILMGLTVAFTTLATTEPVVGRNHAMSAQARAFAEAGIERALWALQNPTAPEGIPEGTTDPASYNGSQFFTVSNAGGFTLRVSAGTSTNERNLVAVGWSPTNEGTDPRPKGIRRIEATLTRVRTPDLPCALCVMGTLQIGGNSRIDGRTDPCDGITVQGGSMSTANTTTSGNARVWGPGNDTYNEPAPDGGLSPDTPADMPSSDFGFKFTADEFALLRSLAKANGSYYQGAQSFSNSRPLPNGVVFVDTTTGEDFTATTPSAQAGSVTVSASQSWSGWLIVAGEISVSGAVSLTGLVYAQNDFTFTGNGEITGAVVTENRKDSISTVVDSAVEGTANLSYNCEAIRTAGGTLPTGWIVRSGSFREVEGR